MQTKKVEIEFNGKPEIVELKRLNFGELNQLTEEATDIRVLNGQPVVKISQKALKEISLLKSITNAPFTIDLKSIQELPSEVGTLLYEEFTELNSQSLKKN